MWRRRGKPNLTASRRSSKMFFVQLIDLLLRVVLDPDDVVVNTPPTFGMYSFDCAVNGSLFSLILASKDPIGLIQTDYCIFLRVPFFLVAELLTSRGCLHTLSQSMFKKLRKLCSSTRRKCYFSHLRTIQMVE